LAVGLIILSFALIKIFFIKKDQVLQVSEPAAIIGSTSITPSTVVPGGYATVSPIPTPISTCVPRHHPCLQTSDHAGYMSTISPPIPFVSSLQFNLEVLWLAIL
jgi:hypothetical protein